MTLAFTSWSFDKPVYTPGEPITLTVEFTSSDLVSSAAVASAVTVVLSDAAGQATQASDASGNFPEFSTQASSDTPQPVTASATDSRTPSGTWTAGPVTFTGAAAPFSGTAVLTSTA